MDLEIFLIRFFNNSHKNVQTIKKTKPKTHGLADPDAAPIPSPSLLRRRWNCWRFGWVLVKMEVRFMSEILLFFLINLKKTLAEQDLQWSRDFAYDGMGRRRGDAAITSFERINGERGKDRDIRAHNRTTICLNFSAKQFKLSSKK